MADALSRYRVPSGFAKSKVLFSLHRATLNRRNERSSSNLLKLREVPPGGGRCVAGWWVRKMYESESHALMCHFRHIILRLDEDGAGGKRLKVIATKV
jgi:hypothetical protein